MTAPRTPAATDAEAHAPIAGDTAEAPTPGGRAAHGRSRGEAGAAPLELAVDGHKLTFATLGDFDFSLTGRAQVSAGAVTQLMQLSAAELRREATGIRDLERRFVDLLAEAAKDPGAIGRQLGGIEPMQIAEDNRWRQIVCALAALEPGYEAYKRVALVKYVQYLAARRDIVKGIYAQRFAGHEPLPGADGPANAALKETVVVDSQSGDATDPVPVRYRRLPRGESVQVAVPDDGSIPIVLARHKFLLFAGRHPRLTDDNGVNYPLKIGINVVGRHPGNDVVVGGWYRDVSRKHMLVDATRGDVVQLTDLSTHGTFVPGALLPAAADC
ncbi:MAG: FHA domain-containing protein [Gammaproteobacteria bacterium]|nr:FHA domain-containing protein [Gammaproteobacteria bacterium]